MRTPSAASCGMVFLCLAACDPDTPPADDLVFEVELVSAQFLIDLTYPDSPPFLAEAKLDVDYEPAGHSPIDDPLRDVPVTLVRVTLGTTGSSSVVAASPVGQFVDDQITVSIGKRFDAFGFGFTTSDLAQFCDRDDVVLAVFVKIEECGSACETSVTMPVSVECRPDRRRPDELAEQGEAPPTDMPCAFVTTLNGVDSRTELGWRDGNLIYEDEWYRETPTIRRYYRYDEADRPIEIMEIDRLTGELTLLRTNTWGANGDLASYELTTDFAEPSVTYTFAYEDDDHLGWVRRRDGVEIEVATYDTFHNVLELVMGAESFSIQFGGNYDRESYMGGRPSPFVLHAFRVTQLYNEEPTIRSQRDIVFDESNRITSDILSVVGGSAFATVAWDYVCD